MKYVGLMIALAVAGVAAFMVLKFSGGEDEPAPVMAAPSSDQPMQVSQPVAPQVETVNVYVASNYIPIGTIIEENMLTVQPWPQHLQLPGFVVGPEEGKKIIGNVTRAPFQSMEPIIKTKIVNPEDPNFLAGDLPKGKRVVTLATDEIAGVAGFIFPGDRIDVIIHHRILKEGVTQDDIKESGTNADDVTEAVSETLLTNVRVLAVDQRASSNTDEEGGIIIPKSVTIEVSPEDAQRVVLARQSGDLSLSLRSIQDKDTIETVAITRQSDLSQFDMSSIAQKKEDDEEPVKVVRGTDLMVVEEESGSQ